MIDVRMSREAWSRVFTHKYDPLKAGSIDSTDSKPHDRGIIRALEARYKPNKAVEGHPDCTIFVSRLNFDTTEERLKKEFSTHGTIKRIRIVRDIVTGASKGYAFIEYELETDARSAYYDMNKRFLDGNMIFVDFEQERKLENWVPRRLGGGIGGKKESGQLRFGGRDKPFIKPIVLPEAGQSKTKDDGSDSGSYRDHGERHYDRGSSFRRSGGRSDTRRDWRSDSRDYDRRQRSRRSRSRNRDTRRKHSRSRSRDRDRKRDRSQSRDRSRHIKQEKR